MTAILRRQPKSWRASRMKDSLLGKLAFLITGDQATADQSVVNAREITLHGNSPFRNWLLEWAKIATITCAAKIGGDSHL